MNREFLIVLAFCLAAQPVMAGEALKTAPATLDPAKAYLLVTINDTSRLAPHPNLIISRYDPKGKDIRGKAATGVEPLAPGEDAGVSVSRRTFLLRQGLSRVHLVTLEPGDYVIEGVAYESGPIATSFALGSYWFTLKPGVVSDLGEGTLTVDTGGESLASEMVKAAFLPLSTPKMDPFVLAFRPSAPWAKATVGALAYETVDLKTGATFGNYMRGALNKIDGPTAATE